VITGPHVEAVCMAKSIVGDIMRRARIIALYLGKNLKKTPDELRESRLA